MSAPPSKPPRSPSMPPSAAAALPRPAPARRAERVRLDQLLVERGLAESRSRAQALLLGGRVAVGEGDGRRRDRKPGDLVTADVAVAVEAPEPYVSRGGHKLAAALDAFAIDPAGRACLDVGASTGGFTDVLLQRGARRVYAVDVGRGQLAERLRQDPRVVSMERTNARALTAASLSEPAELATIDVSFISLALVLGPVASTLAPGPIPVVALVKPQFEAGRADARGGVVRDPTVHRRVLRAVADAARVAGLGTRAVIASPLRGPEGNREFLIHLAVGPSCVELDAAIDAAVDAAWAGAPGEAGVGASEPSGAVDAAWAGAPGAAVDVLANEADDALGGAVDALANEADDAQTGQAAAPGETPR